MEKFSRLEEIFKTYGCADFKFISSKDIVVSQWVRMKCSFGCGGYGKSLSCPPNVPPINECRDLFGEFKDAVLFHFEAKFENPEDRKPWSDGINEKLLNIEREAFLSGYYKAFMMPINECRRCSKCSGKKESCPHPDKLRPMPEAMGVDLFATARKSGYSIDVLKNYGEAMNRFAILLLD